MSQFIYKPIFIPAHSLRSVTLPRTVEKKPNTNTSTSKIIMRSTLPQTDINRDSTSRLLAVEENAINKAKLITTKTVVPTKNPRKPTINLQFGQYYQTEKNSVNQAIRKTTRSSGSVAPPNKYRIRSLF